VVSDRGRLAENLIGCPVQCIKSYGCELTL